MEMYGYCRVSSKDQNEAREKYLPEERPANWALRTAHS